MHFDGPLCYFDETHTWRPMRATTILYLRTFVFGFQRLISITHTRRLYGSKLPVPIAVSRLQAACTLPQQLVLGGGAALSRPIVPSPRYRASAIDFLATACSTVYTSGACNTTPGIQGVRCYKQHPYHTPYLPPPHGKWRKTPGIHNAGLKASNFFLYSCCSRLVYTGSENLNTNLRQWFEQFKYSIYPPASSISLTSKNKLSCIALAFCIRIV